MVWYLNDTNTILFIAQEGVSIFIQSTLFLNLCGSKKHQIYYSKTIGIILTFQHFQFQIVQSW